MNGNTQEVKTVCGACTNSCSLKVVIKDGKVDKIKGYAEDPRTKGSICSKGLSAKQLLTDPKRLQYPVKRVGERGENKWERISWEEALTEIARVFNEVRAESARVPSDFITARLPAGGSRIRCTSGSRTLSARTFPGGRRSALYRA